MLGSQFSSPGLALKVLSAFMASGDEKGSERQHLS